jgi:multidrug resistance efflux pump
MRSPLPRPLVLFAAFAALAACAADPREAPLVLAGSLEARTVEVGSLVGGRVARVAVDEGAQVTPGELLVELESDLLDREITGQQAAIDEAEARLALTLEGPRTEAVRRARIEWQAAETDLGRIAALAAEGIADQQTLDRAQVRAATARETYDEAERGSRRPEIAAARAAVDAQRAALALLERRREELFVRAPAAGRVEAFDLRPGDLVAPHQAMASILEEDQLWVRVYVPEPSLGRVHVGQSARVRVDTWPEREFAARVVEIRPRAEYLPRNVQTLDQRSDQVFAVKVELVRDEGLRPGMAAFVTLIEGDAVRDAEPSS